MTDQIVDGRGSQRGVTGQSGIHIGDVGLVMLIVVELHRFGVDEWFKRGVVVGQWCKFISHRGISSVRIVRCGWNPALSSSEQGVGRLRVCSTLFTSGSGAFTVDGCTKALEGCKRLRIRVIRKPLPVAEHRLGGPWQASSLVF